MVIIGQLIYSRGDYNYLEFILFMVYDYSLDLHD